MTIPKIIHYVWLGRSEYPNDIKKCMKTWKKTLPDFTFMEWNEDNFDINVNRYVSEAYKQEKWAFVSDYIRASVVYQYGGVYFDTDVLVIREIHELLESRAFVGFETPEYPFTAVFGAEMHHPFMSRILEQYSDLEFEFNSDDQLAGVNTKSVSNILLDEYKCIPNNKYQILKDGVVVYPDSYLCNPSENSYTVHVFTGTWMEGSKSWKRRLNKTIKLNLTTHKRIRLYNKILGVFK